MVAIYYSLLSVWLMESAAKIRAIVIGRIGNKASEKIIVKEFTVAHSVNRYLSTAHNELDLMFGDDRIGILTFEHFIGFIDVPHAR
jgi:hypothetical protein